MRHALPLSFALLALAAAARADLVTNGSFEDGNYTGSYQAAGSTDIAGWTIATGSVDWATGVASGPYGSLEASEGLRFIDLTGLYDNSLNRLTQTLATTPGAVYALTFDVGWTSALSSSPIRVTVGGTTMVYDPAALGVGTAQIAWHGQSLLFTALSATTVVSFENTLVAQFGAIDNVHAEAQAVPGPASALSLVTGLGGLAARRRSRRK